jgi:hypothetical protein
MAKYSKKFAGVIIGVDTAVDSKDVTKFAFIKFNNHKKVWQNITKSSPMV